MAVSASSETLNILVKNFNSYATTLASFVASVTHTKYIQLYYDEIVNLDRKNSSVLIDTFVLNLLIYEQQIMEGNDAFFLGKTFDDIDTDNDKNIIMKIFEFKHLWLKINENNKEQIKNYMKILCQIARAYTNIILQART